MYIENRDIDIIENKYSSLPICSRLPVYRVGSNLRRSARFFFLSLSPLPPRPPLSLSGFIHPLFFIPFFFLVYFLIIPPILSLSRIDQNPADRIKSISSLPPRLFPVLSRPLVPISFVFNTGKTRSMGGGISFRTPLSNVSPRSLANRDLESADLELNGD